MKNKKSNLDERQEQELLKIEHNGCWLAFWGLLIAMAVQMVIYGYDVNGMKAMIGEWIVFMILTLYIAIGCLKHNIWDRRFAADTKTNVITSILAGLGMGILNMVSMVREYPDAIVRSIATGVFMGVFTFILCLICMEITAGKYRKDKKKLEEALDAEEDDEE